MFRPATFLRLLGLCVGCALVAASPAVPLPPGVPAPAGQATAVKEFRAKLSKLVTLEAGISNAPLKEALEFISDRYDFTILVDTEAFKAENVDAVEDMPVKLPKMIGVQLGTVLRLLLAQVHGSYRIRPDYIEVAPSERVLPQFWKEKRNLAPTVTAEFAGHPLDAALRELSEASGLSVVMDGRAGDKARTSVTATLTNVPIDTAVLILADMADLRPIVLDNVLYVTTKENAKQLRAWRDKQPMKANESEKPSSQEGPKPRSAGKSK